MINTTQPITIKRTGMQVLMQGENVSQLIVYGKILLLRKDSCIVLVAATNKKVNLPLTFPAVVDGVTYHVDIPVTEVNASAPVKPAKVKPVDGETKIAICKRIYCEMVGSDKAAIVARFVEEAKCTPAGANTYFITCRKG